MKAAICRAQFMICIVESELIVCSNTLAMLDATPGFIELS